MRNNSLTLLPLEYVISALFMVIISASRSASECSLESEGSDSDMGYRAGGSDTESDVEMEVRRDDPHHLASDRNWLFLSPPR